MKLLIEWFLVTLGVVSLSSWSYQATITVAAPAAGSSLPTTGTINLNNPFPQTVGTITANIGTTCSFFSCTNPTGTYVCTVASTNPASAATHFGVTPAVYASSAATGYSLCSIYAYNQLATTDYISNVVTINIAISVQSNIACGFCSTSGSRTISYKVKITPATTTTSTSTSTTTTSTTTSTSTSTTTSTTTTTTPTTTTTTRTTRINGNQPTTSVASSTEFIQSPGGIAVIAVCSVVGAALLGLILYFSIKACMAAAEASASNGAKLASTVATKPAPAAPQAANQSASTPRTPMDKPSYTSYSSYNNSFTQNQPVWTGTPRPFGNSAYFGQIPSNTMAPTNL